MDWQHRSNMKFVSFYGEVFFLRVRTPMEHFSETPAGLKNLVIWKGLSYQTYFGDR